MKGKKSTKSNKLILIVVIAFVIAAFVFLNFHTVDQLNTKSNIQPTIEYLPEDFHPLKPDGIFEDVDINDYITYNANDLDAKLTGIGEKSLSFEIPEGNISIYIRPFEGRDFDQLMINFRKGEYTEELTFPHYKKIIGEKYWDVIEYNNKGSTNTYFLKGDKYYIEVGLGYLEYETREEGIIDAETFIATIDFK